jgi:dTDP-4-amino-4,6-dideoxygalactose transaminase
MKTAAGTLAVVEDAAQALGSRFAGRPLGTFGACGAFSFHETKNVGCGEGGALTLGDESLLDRAEYLRDKGTNRRRFLRGIVDKYTWVDIGSSYVLSDLNASYLSAQLDQFDRIQARRALLAGRYHETLGPLVESRGGYVIRARDQVQANNHLFGMVLPDGETRDRFIAHMKGHGIIAPFHYVALHRSPMGARFHDGSALPRAEQLSECLVRLPLFFNLSDADQEVVIGRTQEFLDAM